MKTLFAALLALSTVAAIAPANATVTSMNIPSFDGPAFGPADLPQPNGPQFGPSDLPQPNGPAFGPSDVRSFDGPAHNWPIEGGNQR